MAQALSKWQWMSLDVPELLEAIVVDLVLLMAVAKVHSALKFWASDFPLPTRSFAGRTQPGRDRRSS